MVTFIAAPLRRLLTSEAFLVILFHTTVHSGGLDLFLWAL